MAILGHFERFWVILAIFGSVGGPGGSGEMVEGSGRGQLRAWQDLGRGQGPMSGEGSGSDFGRFGPQGSKFRVKGQNLSLRGQNLRVGVRFLVPGVKIWGPRSDFWSQGSKFEVRGQIFGPRGQNLRVEVGFWSFWAFWDPARNPKNSAMSPGPLKKMALCRGILTGIWTGGSFWDQKFD